MAEIPIFVIWVKLLNCLFDRLWCFLGTWINTLFQATTHKNSINSICDFFYESRNWRALLVFYHTKVAKSLTIRSPVFRTTQQIKFYQNFLNIIFNRCLEQFPKYLFIFHKHVSHQNQTN